MNARRLLLAVAAIAIVLVALRVSHNKAPTTDIENALLYPDLLDQLNDAQTLTIKSKDNGVTIRHAGDKWTIADHDDYPALFKNVKQALVELSELKIVEAKTSVVEKYARLGVEDVTTPDAKSVLVTVTGKGDKPLVALLVGKQRAAKNVIVPSHYVRKAGEANAYLVQGELKLSPKPNEWMDTALVNIPLERIRQVTINHYQSAPILISKDKRTDTVFALRNIPPGFTVRSQTNIANLAALLIDVKFENVMSAAKVDTLVPRTIVEIQAFDGLVTTIEEFDYEHEVFARFKFAFNPDLVTATALAAAPADGKTAPAAEQAPKTGAPAADVAAEAAALNAKMDGWVYVLPDYKLRILDRKLDDLVKPQEPPKKQGEGPANAEGLPPPAN